MTLPILDILVVGICGSLGLAVTYIVLLTMFNLLVALEDTSAIANVLIRSVSVTIGWTDNNKECWLVIIEHIRAYESHYTHVSINEILQHLERSLTYSNSLVSLANNVQLATRCLKIVRWLKHESDIDLVSSHGGQRLFFGLIRKQEMIRWIKSGI